MIAASFNLRQYCQKKKLMGMERTSYEPQFPLETLKERMRRQRVSEHLERVRQKEEDHRGVEAARRKVELKRAAEEKAKREAAEEATRMERLLRENAIYRAEQERQEEADRKVREEKQRKVEEKARAKREAFLQDRQRRMPWKCENCSGSGVCPECGGKGLHASVFLK